MTSYELAGVILLTTVAAEPLVAKVTTKAIFGVGVLTLLTWLFSRLAIIEWITPILEHTPTIIIKNGQLDMKSLRSINLSINQVQGLLRQKGFAKISDIDYAILEPQGKISVLPKPQKRPVQTGDLNIPTQYEGLTIPLIIDGSIIKRNLNHLKLDRNWLVDKLAERGISNYKKEVNLAELDAAGNLHISYSADQQSK